MALGYERKNNIRSCFHNNTDHLLQSGSGTNQTSTANDKIKEARSELEAAQTNRHSPENSEREKQA
ncbi:hypothetical protein PanWU01x14_136510, partial [Parasponia andersonii]